MRLLQCLTRASRLLESNGGDEEKALAADAPATLPVPAAAPAAAAVPEDSHWASDSLPLFWGPELMASGMRARRSVVFTLGKPASLTSGPAQGASTTAPTAMADHDANGVAASATPAAERAATPMGEEAPANGTPRPSRPSKRSRPLRLSFKDVQALYRDLQTCDEAKNFVSSDELLPEQPAPAPAPAVAPQEPAPGTVDVNRLGQQLTEALSLLGLQGLTNEPIQALMALPSDQLTQLAQSITASPDIDQVQGQLLVQCLLAIQRLQMERGLHQHLQQQQQPEPQEEAARDGQPDVHEEPAVAVPDATEAVDAQELPPADRPEETAQPEPQDAQTAPEAVEAPAFAAEVAAVPQADGGADEMDAEAEAEAAMEADKPPAPQSAAPEPVASAGPAASASAEASYSDDFLPPLDAEQLATLQNFEAFARSTAKWVATARELMSRDTLVAEMEEHLARKRLSCPNVVTEEAPQLEELVRTRSRAARVVC